MRKRLKKKKRSCPMCKPHKTGGGNRWSVKDRDSLRRSEVEIASEAGEPINTVRGSVQLIGDA